MSVNVLSTVCAPQVFDASVKLFSKLDKAKCVH